MKRLAVLHPQAAMDAFWLLVGAVGCGVLVLAKWLSGDDELLADLGGDD